MHAKMRERALRRTKWSKEARALIFTALVTGGAINIVGILQENGCLQFAGAMTITAAVAAIAAEFAATLPVMTWIIAKDILARKKTGPPTGHNPCETRS